MYRCHGCDRELRDYEEFTQAALEYNFCAECVEVTTPIQLKLALT